MKKLQDERGDSAERDSMRGQHLERLGRHDEALKAYRDALARDPTNVQVLRLLAYCQLRSGRNGSEALTTIERAIALDPEECLNHVIHSLILSDRNRSADAREAAGRAIELDPEEALGHSALAQAHMKAKAWAEAEAAAKEALALDPDEDMAGTLLAHALFCQGKQAENRGHIGYLLQRDPEDPHAHHAAGLAALQASDFGKAEEHFLEALRLDPEFDPAREGLLDAFRARSFLYRTYLHYGFFMTRLTPGQRMGLVIGVLVLVQVLLRSLRQVSAGLSLGVASVYVLIVVWTYVAGAVGSLIVMGDRRARQALKPWQRWEALLAGGGALGGFFLAVVSLTFGSVSLMAVGVALMAATVPLVLALNSTERRGRRVFGSLAALSVAGCGLLALHWVMPSQTLFGFGLVFACLGLLLSTWWSALGAARR